MKYKILTIITLLIFSCNSSNQEKTPTTNIKQNNPIFINFLERKIYFPDDYIESNVKTLSESIFDLSVLNNNYLFDFSRYQNLKRMEENGAIFFVNQKKPNDHIIFIPGSEFTKFDLNKNTVQYYVKMLERQFKETEHIIKRERLKSQLLKLGKTRAIKVKYIEDLNGKLNFMTNYIVAYKHRTFSIIINSTSNQDFTPFIRNFKD